MKLTFPHIGEAHLIGRIFFSEIGIEIIAPPTNTVRVLEKGSVVSPDEICIPFKLMVENLIEAHLLGADTVIMPATMGPCRLGEYAELMKSILDKRGCRFRWILLDSVKAIGKREILRRLSEIVSDSDKSRSEILRALYGTYRILKNIELMDHQAHLMAGYELKKGSCRMEVRCCRRELEQCGSISEAMETIRMHTSSLEKLPMDRSKKPLRILLTGEIFSMIEPFANHHIESLLMDLGVSFERRVTLGWWIRRTIFDPFQLRRLVLGSNRYLPYTVGGYAKETVEEGVLCGRKRYDGVIQIFPAGCMPEIIAKVAFARMAKEESINVLTVIYDEMAGEAGYITRIEAFVDMLNRKKDKENRNAISRH